MVVDMNEISLNYAAIFILRTAIGVLADALRCILKFVRQARGFSCCAISRKVPGTFPDLRSVQ